MTDKKLDKKATPMSSNAFASMIPLVLAKYNDIADCNPVLNAFDKINFQYSLFFIVSYSSSTVPPNCLRL